MVSGGGGDIAMTKVFIIESKADWGTRMERTQKFKTRKKAEQFCREYNSRHNPIGPTPDWYMYARIEDQKEYGMLRLKA